MSFCELRAKALYLCFYSGWNGRTRTANPPVNSRMLYQLSYEPILHRETHHSKNLSFHLLKINPNHLLYYLIKYVAVSVSTTKAHLIFLKNGKNTRNVAVSALNGLSGGTRTHSLVTPNHAVYQLAYTQIYGGAGGNRTRVRNSYMSKTFLRNSRLLSVCLSAGATMSAYLTQGVPDWYRLHHLVCVRETRKPNDLFFYPQALTRPSALFWMLKLVQAATRFATKAAKAGLIITTVSSFNFVLILQAVSFLRVLHSQNPVEPITAPYLIVVETERIELSTSRLSVVRSPN